MQTSRVNLRWHSTNYAFWHVHDAKSNMELFDTLLSSNLLRAHTLQACLYLHLMSNEG